MSLSTLSLKEKCYFQEKVEVIKAAESSPKLGIRKLAELYDCGKVTC